MWELRTGIYPALPYVSVALAALVGIVASTRSYDGFFTPRSASARQGHREAENKTNSQRTPYPPDALPGRRTVATPYGTVNVFEWGPESGRKVLLIHGISTPCIALGPLAERLEEGGCRVMLFDLFGRGYSENSPSHVHHDAQLYMLQIMAVLSSSPISWFTPPGFDLVGYSFGGGIAVSFNRYFPDLVRSLTLLAPGGIMRPGHVSWRSRILYSTGLFPESLLRWLVKQRLEPKEVVTEIALNDEAPDMIEGDADHEDDPYYNGGTNFDSTAITLKSSKVVSSISSVISWQLANNLGFVPAFMSSIRYGPIQNQQKTWAELAEFMDSRRASSTSQESDEDFSDQVLLILGDSDPVVIKEELTVDATAVLGTQNLEIKIIEGGHELPISQSGEVANVMQAVWIRE